MKSKDTADIVKGGMRSVAASVPIISSFAQAWSEIESALRERRVDEFFRQFRMDLQSVSDRLGELEEQVRKQGDLPQIIERVVDRVRRETSDTKARRYSLLLRNMMVSDPPVATDRKIDAIETLDSLTDQDIRLLAIFSEKKRLRVDSLVSNQGIAWAPVGAKNTRWSQSGSDEQDDSFAVEAAGSWTRRGER